MTRAANDNGGRRARAVKAAFPANLAITEGELRLVETHCAALIQRLTAAIANDRLEDELEKDDSDASGDLRAGLDDAAGGE